MPLFSLYGHIQKWCFLSLKKLQPESESEKVRSIVVVVICCDSITCNGEMNYVKIVLLAKIGMWFENFHFFAVLTEIIVWKLKPGLSLIRT